MSFVESETGRAFVKEGTFDAVKVGAGETYLSAFGVFLGGTAMQIGALATLPPLIGSIFQTMGVTVVERGFSRRAVLLVLMYVQALLWLPIAILPFLPVDTHVKVLILIALVVVHQMTVGVIAPTWSSLIGDLVPPEERGQYFGFRNRYIAVATFLSLLVAGELVHQCTNFGYTELGFFLIFLIAAIARISSARYFRKTEDPSLHVPEESKFTFWQFVRRVKVSNFVRFVLFVSSMNFAVAIAGPYFAMYMLRDLGMSYMEYTLIVAVAVIAQFLVMRAWGRLSDLYGSKKILKVCGWMAATNPIWWLVSDKIWYLVILQFWSGFVWAGFTLAAANFVFDAVVPAKRARCIAYQAIINGTLVFIGSLLAGLLATHIPYESLPRIGLWVPNSPFLILFLLSGALRIAVMMTLYPAFKEVRTVQRIRSHELLIRVTSIRPISGGATFAFITQRRKRKDTGGVDDTEPLA